MHVRGSAGADGICCARGEKSDGKACFSAACRRAIHTALLLLCMLPALLLLSVLQGLYSWFLFPFFSDVSQSVFPEFVFSFVCSPGARASVSIAVCSSPAAALAHRAAAHPTGFPHCPAHMESAIQNASALVRRRHGRADGSFPAPPFRRANAVFYGCQHQPHNRAIFRHSASVPVF